MLACPLYASRVEGILSLRVTFPHHVQRGLSEDLADIEGGGVYCPTTWAVVLYVRWVESN